MKSFGSHFVLQLDHFNHFAFYWLTPSHLPFKMEQTHFNLYYSPSHDKRYWMEINIPLLIAANFILFFQLICLHQIIYYYNHDIHLHYQHHINFNTPTTASPPSTPTPTRNASSSLAPNIPFIHIYFHGYTQNIKNYHYTRSFPCHYLLLLEAQ